MSIDIEYAIKTDVRNNPVLREVDVPQRREFQRIVLLTVLIVAVLLFSAWQRARMVGLGRDIEQLRLDQAYEETVNRQLRLNVETLQAPQPLEQRALKIGMQAPGPKDTIVLERAHTNRPSSAIVARAR